jgi:hypothetical protein
MIFSLKRLNLLWCFQERRLSARFAEVGHVFALSIVRSADGGTVIGEYAVLKDRDSYLDVTRQSIQTLL